MMRQNAYLRSSFAAVSIEAEEQRRLRKSGPHGARSMGRLLLVPLALLAAALAGVVFVILLPICGIASIAEAAAKSSWAFVRDAFRHPREAIGRR